jgi:hypothetical protein
MRKICLLALLLLSSCGWVDDRFGRIQGASTEANFKFNQDQEFSTQALELYGNIAIYLVGVNGNPYSTNLVIGNRFEPASITLPNGSYRAYAVGWEGDNSGACTSPSPCSPVQGQARCSDPNAPVVNLTGGRASVNLNLSTSHCDFTVPSVYSEGQAAATDLKPLNVKICGSASSLPTCNTPGSSWDVSMELVVYQKNGNALSVNEALTKQFGCLTGVANAGAPSAKNFPVGYSSAADRPFTYRFRVFPNGSSCSGALQAEFLFGEGLSAFATAPGSGVSYFDYFNGGGSHAVLYLKGPF